MWKLRRNGILPVANQGPPVDHTSYSPTGNYMYLSTSNGTALNSPARLITPVLSQAS
ncbi:unnamed protein product, partial [Rotaria magnacalcarata]